MKRPTFLIRRENLYALIKSLETKTSRAQTIETLQTLSYCHRVNALAAIYAANHGWLGASFSVADILTVLYHASVEPDEPIVLCKGHAAAMQYAILASLGKISLSDLLRYKTSDGPQAHTDIMTPGIKVNSGSLGQGLSKCVGLGWQQPHRVFPILGDGELQEGQNYEALMTISHYNLRNVIPVIDINCLQSDSNVSAIMGIPALKPMLESFGFDTIDVNGNDIASLYDVFSELGTPDRPTVILAKTRKGAGLPFAECDDTDRRDYKWHGAVPEQRDYQLAVRELTAQTGLPELEEQAINWIELLPDNMSTPTSIPQAQHSRSDRPDLSTGKAFGETLCNLVKNHPTLYALDADLEKPCKLTPFATQYPDNFIEVGIAEQDMISIAGGLTLAGKLPVVNTYASFFRRAFEQIYVNATEKTSVIYAGHYAGLCYTTDGKTHQCTGDIAMMRSIPNMMVTYPAFPEEIEQILEWYLSTEPDSPLYIRLHRTPACNRPFSNQTIEFRYGWGTCLANAVNCSSAVLTSGPHMTERVWHAVSHLRESNSAVPAIYSITSLRHTAEDFAKALFDKFDEIIIVEELIDSGGLFDEITNAFARLTTSGYGSRPPILKHRCCTGMTHSTRDPGGLYAAFGLDVDSLIEFLTQNCLNNRTCPA